MDSSSLRALRFALCAFLVYGCSQPINKALEGTGLSFACAVGDVTEDRAIVWLRAEGESSVSVHYGREPGLTYYRSSRKRQAARETDFTAQILISGLKPKTTYYYRATVAGRTPGPICKFVTAPRMDDSADVLFAFGGDISFISVIPSMPMWKALPFDFPSSGPSTGVTEMTGPARDSFQRPVST